MSHSYSGMGSLLTNLTLPRLATLKVEIDPPEDDTNNPSSTFTELVSRSSSPLVDLVFHYGWLMGLDQCLPSISSLESVTTEDGLLTPFTMASISRGECARNLISLACSLYLEDRKLFFEMLEKRWAMEAASKSLTSNVNQDEMPSMPMKPLNIVHIILRSDDDSDFIDENWSEQLEAQAIELQAKYGL